MRVTLKDIAEKSGYSITTVSRALGGFDDVNEGTRKRIVTIADDMGYQPNLIARQLRDRRTNTIGIIAPMNIESAEDDFFNILIKGIAHTASLHRYDLLISAQLPSHDEMDAYRRIAGGNRVDGLIVARTYRDDPRIAYLSSNNIPFVVSGRSAPGETSDFHYIDVDSQTGLRLAVEHFVDYGHQHIGLILPPAHLAFTAYRLKGYQDGLDGAGLPFREEYVTYGDLHRESGQQQAEALIQAHPELTAIIACNDLMALGAMRGVRNCGLRVGEDIAICGFDDIPAAQHVTPTLTTIYQPIFEIGEGLTTRLLNVISQEAPIEKGILLDPQLVIRESSGKKRV